MIIKAQRQSAFFIWLIVSAVLFIIYFLIKNLFPIISNIVGICLLFLCTALSVYFHLLVYKTKCEIQESKVMSVTGVIIKRRSYVNIKNVLYYTICKTPLSKISGLNFIILNTFGGRTVLMFLSIKDCKLIEELLCK